jgi:hypothetical protein
MKKILYSLFFVFICCQYNTASTAPHAQEQFLKANEFYKQGKYEEAYQRYLAVPSKSAFVHYNLGNCAYKLTRYGQALVHWRRAEMCWGIFNREDLLSNIELVKNKLGLSIQKDKKSKDKEGPGAEIAHIWQGANAFVGSFVCSASLFFFQFLFLLVWLLLLLYIRYFYKLHLNSIFFLLIFMCGSSVCLLVSKYIMISKIYGVVVSGQAKLFSGPGKTYQELGKIREGQEGVIKKKSEDFYKVNVGGKSGWVNKDSVESL